METNGLNESVQSEQLEPAVQDTHNEPETTAFTGMSKDELLKTLGELIEEKPVTEIKADVDAIKVAFYKRHKSEVESEKAAFLAGGGKEEDFKPQTDDSEKKLKELLAVYREKREKVNQDLSAEHAKNYAAKLEVIERLKRLVETGETDVNAFDTFKKLQQEWNSTGPVDKAKVNDLWNNYHLQVENFYNILKVNKELRDLDLKKNFEAKNALCEQAESLMLEPMVVEAFRKLQLLHDEWREIGPVAKELKEEQWERFKRASVIINKKHQDYFENIRQEQITNLNLKTELCNKARVIAEKELTTKKEWEEETNNILELQKLWRTIGFAPKKDNNRVYEEFRSLCNSFFAKKRDYFASLKGSYQENIDKKNELCLKAEELQSVDYQSNEEWGKVTEQLIALQKEWKSVGPVPKKESDELWARFRKACDGFFEKKSAFYESLDKQYDVNLKAKKDIIEELKNFSAESPAEALEKLKEIQSRWGQIGFVSIKVKDKVNSEYRELINGLFKTFKGDYNEQKLEKFKSKVSNIKSSKGKGALYSDREKMAARVRQLENDIALWENNIGFFAKSANAQAMIQDVENKIKAAKDNIQSLIEKIKIIDSQQ